MFENDPKETTEQNSDEVVNHQETDPCSLELQEYKKKYMYLNAEFDNYRKRIEKEKKQWVQYGEDLVLKNILAIIDNFDRAFQILEKQEVSSEIQSQLEGFKLIQKSLHELLSKFGVAEVPGGEFNPEIHEALSQVESDKNQPGQIVEIYEKGYMHNGQLLRPAKVSVAK